jgi:hypothetical protein
MTQFDDRKKAFEDKFAHDQELQFRTMARRNKLFGLWAAQKMGIDPAKRDEYAQSVVMADFDEPGDDDVLRKVAGDFEAAGITLSREILRHEMTQLLEEAKRQLMQEQ